MAPLLHRAAIIIKKRTARHFVRHFPFLHFHSPVRLVAKKIIITDVVVVVHCATQRTRLPDLIADFSNLLTTLRNNHIMEKSVHN